MRLAGVGVVMSTASVAPIGASAPASSTLALLQQQYPNRIALDCKELATVIGACDKHIANRAAAGAYPIRSLKIGGKRVFTIVDIARFLDGDRTRRGRPTKIDQIARRETSAVQTVGMQS